jgi:hypothetical protein
MLFDLQGRRRRVIQGVYLMLALLMGGGLVLFGIGSDQGQGGLVDAFTGSGGNQSSGDSMISDRVEQAEERLRANPRDEAALAAVVRGRYQLATAKTGANSTSFPPEAQADLQGASRAWDRYLALKPARPDDSLAGLMLQAYSEFGLRRPDKATEAAEIVATARPSSSSWLGVAQYATLAGDKKKADTAGRRATSLASGSQRKAVRQQLAALEAAVKAQESAQRKARSGGEASAPGASGGLPGAVPTAPSPGGAPAPSGGGAPPPAER